MRTALLAVLFVAALVAVSASWGHHNHHKPPPSPEKQCHYQTEKGSYDLRLLMRDMNGKDWELRDERTQSTFFFNPCGGVHNPACPPGSALCEITNKQEAMSYGNAAELTWAEGHEDSVELTYANGEKCDNGMPRKTLVQMTCSKPTSDKMTQLTVITDMSIDDCLVTLKMKSPYACAIEQLCTVFDKEQCEASQDLCAWRKDHHKGKCVVTTTSCFKIGRHHLSFPAVLGLLASLSVLGFCGLTLCLCVCCVRRRRSRRSRRTLPTKTAKTVAKEEPTAVEEFPQPQFIYQPMQQLQGAYPGHYAELNPYGLQLKDGVAIPMVQFVPNTSVQN
jgi:hypothetical protein